MIPVSIRARPIGRAMRAFGGALSRRSVGFNPRPANWPGDATGECGGRCTHPVSIRARPIGRAMRWVKAAYDWGRGVSIRARPIGRAMRWVKAAYDWGRGVSIRARPIGRAMPEEHPDAASVQGFQSAPGQLAGRCVERGRRVRHDHSFNPRPANWPGDAPSILLHSSHCKSFNPRPANWPGDAFSAGSYSP